MLTVFLLLIAFQLKHFICDYPLQTQYMLRKMQTTGWVKPLAAHAGVHAIGTFMIAYYFLNLSYYIDNVIFAATLAITDLILHFIVDRLKASPTIGGRFKPDQSYFWWALGADQMAHHLINYIFIFIIVQL